MMGLNYTDFEDGWDPFRVATKYGLYKGDYFLEWIQQLLERKLNLQPTFADLKTDLHVFATNLNTRGLKEFSKEKTPTVSVAEAVRCSMSIPLFFASYQLDGDLYVDGGVILNYPFGPFEHPEPKVVLALHLDDLQNKKPPHYDLGYDDIVGYVKGLFETLVDAQQAAEFDDDPIARRQSVRIDDFGISATDFNITEQQKEALYESGYKYTSAFLNGGASRP